jgi:MFS family permease
VDLVVNGTFWVGGAIGSLASIYLLSGHAIGGRYAWRYAFGIGGLLGVIIFVLRLTVPESPRWLMLRGQEQRANDVVDEIEGRVMRNDAGRLPKPEGDALKIKVRDHTPWREIFGNMFGENRQRTYLGLILMVAQAFFFNAVFFSYGLVGKAFFHFTDKSIPWHLLPFAIASFLGPLTIGRLFDTIGRKKDDFRHLRLCRSSAGSRRCALRDGASWLPRPWDQLHFCLFHSFIGSERGLSHRE